MSFFLKKKKKNMVPLIVIRRFKLYIFDKQTRYTSFYVVNPSKHSLTRHIMCRPWAKYLVCVFVCGKWTCQFIIALPGFNKRNNYNKVLANSELSRRPVAYRLVRYASNLRVRVRVSKTGTKLSLPTSRFAYRPFQGGCYVVVFCSCVGGFIYVCFVIVYPSSLVHLMPWEGYTS